ncbi:twin-arginine translocase TatA/TatE family subunit [Demequina sp. NBRC 110054]|uniref:twin-arginine translocase TatA/TatE family subunit n=1 Tax=Demequina sp. NBRC 110054 TaxID=1570343 RepID=UPI000A006EAB|nr:twin-arginine translocase TatA/TatE family subunit [Demequina sp. NBRC 110054]
MLANLTGWHAILILVVVLLVFGASKLPELAKSVGQSVKILKDEVAEGSKDSGAKPAVVDGSATSAATSASTSDATATESQERAAS